MKLRFEVIQYLIDTFGYKRYLELGCRKAEGNRLSIDHINCEHKDSVDINNNGNNYVMTTDQFFKSIPSEQKYDIIFIDADHEKSAVLRDVNNSLKHLTDGGAIVCHDVNPPSERHLLPRFCNNCWEAWVEMRSTRDDLEMYAVDVNMVGIIRNGTQRLYNKPIEPTWNFLETNRKELLNLITEQEFKEIFKQ